MELPTEQQVIDRLTTWANTRPAIRAMILTSSRVRPGGPVDVLSDYDIILAVTEAEQLARDEAWVHDYGRPMARWGDQNVLVERPYPIGGCTVATGGCGIDWALRLALRTRASSAG